MQLSHGGRQCSRQHVAPWLFAVLVKATGFHCAPQLIASVPVAAPAPPVRHGAGDFMLFMMD